MLDRRQMSLRKQIQLPWNEAKPAYTIWNKILKMRKLTFYFTSDSKQIGKNKLHKVTYLRALLTFNCVPLAQIFSLINQKNICRSTCPLTNNYIVRHEQFQSFFTVKP